MRLPFVIQHHRSDIENHPWRHYPPGGDFATREEADARIIELQADAEEGWEYRVMRDTGMNILVDP